MNKYLRFESEQVMLFDIFQMPRLSNLSTHGAIILFTLCASQDFFNFLIGKSWTPFQN